MENLLFSLNIILPLAILITLGYIFKKIGFFNDQFISMGKKLCFYVLLACTLFKNLYDSSIDVFPIRLISLVVISIVVEFIVSCLVAKAISDKRNEIGVIIQGSFRSNFAYIGIPLASLMFSESSLVSMTNSKLSIISVFAIPLFNILSVFGFAYFNEDESENLLKRTIVGIIRNPCIISITLGLCVLLFRHIVPTSSFFIRDNLNFLYKVISYLSSMSTPFALLLVGASLNLSHSIANIKKLVWVVGLKDLIYPVVILMIAYLLKGYDKVDFALLVSTFASPTAVASAIMASELGGDYDLANEIVVYTTIFSILSLLIIIFGLKTMGCL